MLFPLLTPEDAGSQGKGVVCAQCHMVSEGKDGHLSQTLDL